MKKIQVEFGQEVCTGILVLQVTPRRPRLWSPEVNEVEVLDCVKHEAPLPKKLKGSVMGLTLFIIGSAIFVIVATVLAWCMCKVSGDADTQLGLK